ncbi:zinc-binding dehydrogenase, partial [Colletotrichum scovillei]
MKCGRHSSSQRHNNLLRRDSLVAYFECLLYGFQALANNMRLGSRDELA